MRATMKHLPSLALLLVLSAAACKPKAGASCKLDAKEVCVEDKKALACHDGKWEELTCRGPEGCSKSSGEHVCDQSVADDKEACNLADDFVCSADKKAMLQCQKNRWTLVQNCLGDRACAIEKKRVTCDNSVANLGDVCREEDDYACAPDKKSALVCRGGKFVYASQCKGAKGCKVAGGQGQPYKVECDDSIAAPGDACEREEHFSCSSDEKSILRCRGKKFELEEKCKGRDRCQIRNGMAGCF
jgi:hypothetical protein